MNKHLKTGLMLLLTALLAACSTTNPYNSPDSQRDRSKDAQSEMSKDVSK